MILLLKRIFIILCLLLGLAHFSSAHDDLQAEDDGLLASDESGSGDDDALDVLIVGAGWAGMSAAHYLIQNAPELKIAVLESKNYTGGRTHAIKFGNPVDGPGEFIVEIGSNWIHGVPRMEMGTANKNDYCGDNDNGTTNSCHNPTSEVEPNPVMELAERIGLGVIPADDINHSVVVGIMRELPMVYDRVGKDGDPDGSLRSRFAKAAHCLQQKVESKLIRPNSSIRDVLFECGWNPQSDVEWAVDLAATECSGSENDIETAQSLIDDTTFRIFGHADALVVDQHPRGYARLIDALVDKSLPEGDRRIILNSHVVNIDYGIDCGHTEGKASQVVVTTQDGREFRAREVIVTFPLGVLQRHHSTLFTPSLPENLVKTLESGEIQMRNVTKVLLQFSDVWWDNSLPRWVSTNSGGSGTAEADHFSRWRNMNHQSTIPGSNILLGFLGGAQSARYESMANPDAKVAVMSQLRNQFPHIDIPDPVAFHITRHGSDPTRYGAFVVNTRDWSGDYEMFLDPITVCENAVPRIRFGGEAFCGGLEGYTHGAYFSGIEVAGDVLSDFGINPGTEMDSWCE